MAQEIKQANIFGRIGTGIGKGLADQIPKEIERNRLATGLSELGKQEGLTPFQQFAQLSSIPGITPQMIQSGSELLKQQQLREAYKRGRTPGQTYQPQNIPASGNIQDVKFGQLPNQVNRNNQEQEIPQGNYASGEPQIVQKNPLAPELQPAIPWTPEQRNEEISRVWDQYPGLPLPEIMQIVSDNERRYLEAPEAYQKQQQHLKNIQSEANEAIDAQLRKKLHIPKDKEIYEGNKITGETVNRIERGVSRDLRKNPNANVNDLVNTWTDRALENDKQKSQLDKLAARDWSEKLSKRSENLEKLKSISKSFKDFGNSQEYYNTLQSQFGVSPEGAASIAYPLSKYANNYISKIGPSQADNFYENTIKYAEDLGDYLTRDDSILSIAKNIKERDPFFDIKTFLSEIRSNQEDLGLKGQQKLEINERGIQDVFPNWGDIFLFPKLGRGL